MIRVLVTGSRKWTDRPAIWGELDRIQRERGISLLIEGCAAGADRHAEAWAEAREVEVRHFPADWSPKPGLPVRYRRDGTPYDSGAGPTRNLQMLHEGRPDLVLAFPLPGSRGTLHMMWIAKEAGVEVLERGHQA